MVLGDVFIVMVFRFYRVVIVDKGRIWCLFCLNNGLKDNEGLLDSFFYLMLF